MLKIKVIRWKNFLSTGNVMTEVRLDSHRNTLFIGKNGHGKSTVMDAVTFALYGKPYRNINKPDLVSWTNKKDCLVEVEFDTLGKSYMIRRGLKPAVFDIICDGEILNKEASTLDYQEILEKTILKSSYKGFKQINIVSAKLHKPLLELTPAERRIVVEDLLDIRIFSIMNVIAKKRLVDLKEDIVKNSNEYDNLVERISYLEKTIDSIQSNNEDKIEDLKKQIEVIDTTIIASVDREIELKGFVEVLSEEIEKYTKAPSRRSALKDVRVKLNTKLTTNKEDRSFFTENVKCPTCLQGISHDHSQSIISNLDGIIENQIDNITKVEQELKKLDQDIEELERLTKDVARYNAEISKLKITIDSKKSERKRLSNDILKLSKTDDLQRDTEERLQDSKDALVLVKQKKNLLSITKEDLETSIELLKDTGIKAKIIKKYIPILNKKINKYITQMGMDIEFKLDETFKESIKFGYNEISYGSLSAGETMRIDFAILWAFRDIAKQKNSINTNLLILDEVMDSSMDEEGMDEFEQIQKLLPETNTIIISHKPQLQSKFDRVIEFIKEKNYSFIKGSE